MNTKTIVFDIETAALPDLELEQFMPKEWPLGNLKDPEKIKIAIEDKKKAWKEDAALSAITGRVLCIGLHVADTFVLIGPPASEAEILYEFWDSISANGSVHRLIGFNIKLFDLPFLIRRSWKHNLAIPLDLFDGRYFCRQVVDLRDYWQLGDRQAGGSLDAIARHLGIGQKRGTGAEFAALWESDQQKAIEYLKNDLALTVGVAQRMMILE